MYNFDIVPDRKGTYSYKWDSDKNALPMWVADMDFETAPEVKRAIVKRAEHGVFGYTYAPDELFSAVSDFWYRRHGFRFDTEYMVYSSGVVAAISSLVKRLTHPGESVLIQAPVYNIFYNSILNSGRRVVSNDLVRTDGGYEIDFADLEEKLSSPMTRLFILCNPHNPVGKVFTKDELCRIGTLCKKYGVTVISDEIHCEFTRPKRSYTPFASASDVCYEISVTLLSLSKAFNIAGLCSAFAVVKNPALRHQVYRTLNNDEVGEPNAFAVCANLAALTEGEAWLDAMLDYVNENKRIATEYIAKEIPRLSADNSEATYLLWVDISSLGMDSVSFTKELREKGGLYVCDGLEYGECGRYFIRINLATSRERVLKGLSLLRDFVDKCN
ncbi:MAG: pyridoxal phosphate-dependent aminotransferase [Clostridia bacterium]|nr:pyridoxal phosphate-dependent aminotransferase [Clostridia bacterium]